MAIQLGNHLPHFTALTQDGTSFDSHEIQNKPVVIYFYPKDNTPGCTAQACSFRDAYQDFQDLGAEVIGVSVILFVRIKIFKLNTNYPLYCYPMPIANCESCLVFLPLFLDFCRGELHMYLTLQESVFIFLTV
jgi:peroxiredoxin